MASRRAFRRSRRKGERALCPSSEIIRGTGGRRKRLFYPKAGQDCRDAASRRITRRWLAIAARRGQIIVFIENRAIEWPETPPPTSAAGLQGLQELVGRDVAAQHAAVLADDGRRAGHPQLHTQVELVFDGI